MKISCEKCKTLFKIDDKVLSAKGATVICPKCQHPHLAKRIVIPYDELEDKASDKSTDSKKRTKLRKESNFQGENTLLKRIQKFAKMSHSDRQNALPKPPPLEKLKSDIYKIEKQHKLKSKNRDPDSIHVKLENETQDDISESTIMKMMARGKEKYESSEEVVPYSDIDKKALKQKSRTRKRPDKSMFLTLLMTAIFLIFLAIMALALLSRTTEIY